jgi:hypothetical protein
MIVNDVITRKRDKAKRTKSTELKEKLIETL